jgi:hypothetical protein
MKVKRELVATIESLPDDVTMREAVRRLYQLYRIRQGLARRIDDEEGDDLHQETFPPGAERQFAIAQQYPGEYVVLVGEDVISHGPDQAAALAAYRSAMGKAGRHPVLVRPERLAPVPAIVRGRSVS